MTETTETEATKIFEVLKFSAARSCTALTRLLAAPFHVRHNSISCRNSVPTTLHLGRPIIMASARQYITRVVRQATQYSTQMVSTAPHCACARYRASLLTTRVHWKTLFSLKQVSAEDIWNPLTVRGSRVDQLIPQWVYCEILGDIRVRIWVEGRETIFLMCSITGFQEKLPGLDPRVGEGFNPALFPQPATTCANFGIYRGQLKLS